MWDDWSAGIVTGGEDVISPVDVTSSCRPLLEVLIIALLAGIWRVFRLSSFTFDNREQG